MKKKQVQALRYAAAFVVSVAVGVGGNYVWNAALQPQPSPEDAVEASVPVAADAVQLRVRGGVAEWFDGVRWNAAGTVEDMKQNDPAAAKSDTWQALAEKRAAAQEEQRQAALAQLSREENGLATGEKPVVRQPSRRPAASTQTPAGTPSGGGGAPAPAPDPTPAPEQVPAGDGENIDGGALFG